MNCFFATVVSHNSEYWRADGVVQHVCAEFGIRPLTYKGGTLAERNSNLDREIRDNLYGSQIAAVLLVGKDSDGNSVDIADNWIIPELNYILNHGIRLYIYVSADTETEKVQALNLPIDARSIACLDAFEQALRNDLRSVSQTQG